MIQSYTKLYLKSINKLNEIYKPLFIIAQQTIFMCTFPFYPNINIIIAFVIINDLTAIFYRVNLIGEHVDYCGYSVCPMAIEQDVLVAVRKTDHDTELRLTNVDTKYSDYNHEDLKKIQ